MKFSEEISPPSSSSSSSGLLDLDFLLEASNDELCLPPPLACPSIAEKGKEDVDIMYGATGAAGFGQIWGFEDEIMSYLVCPKTGCGSAGKIFVPSPCQLPMHHICHTIEAAHAHSSSNPPLPLLSAKGGCTCSPFPLSYALLYLTNWKFHGNGVLVPA